MRHKKVIFFFFISINLIIIEIFIKDLNIFKDRNLKDILIIDNALYSFAF